MTQTREQVTRVISAHSFETANSRAPVRLADVDAPSHIRPSDPAAKKHLARLLALGDGSVVLWVMGHDEHGQRLALVENDHIPSVNAEMVMWLWYGVSLWEASPGALSRAPALRV